MIKSWRPKDWDKIKAEYNPNYPLVFEAGANAMLEVLRKEGTHLTSVEIEEDIKVDTTQYIEPLIAGTWVFIPDNEQEGR